MRTVSFRIEGWVNIEVEDDEAEKMQNAIFDDSYDDEAEKLFDRYYDRGLKWYFSHLIRVNSC